MSESNTELVKVWAEYAATPFQGKARGDIQRQLTLAVMTAIKAGERVLEGISDVPFAYKWDGENAITAEMDPWKFTKDMLIIRDK